MRRTKTIEQLRMDIARVFFDRTPVRRCYSLEEAVTLLRDIDAGPHRFDECFGGSLKGGMYKHELRSTLTAVFDDTDAVIAALRKQPDTTLDIVTAAEPEEAAPEAPKPLARSCEHGEGVAHNPGGPMHLHMEFKQLQAIAAQLGQLYSCAMCGHRFPPEADTPQHDCKQTHTAHEIVSVQPMTAPVGEIFYTDYVYGPKS